MLLSKTTIAAVCFFLFLFFVESAAAVPLILESPEDVLEFSQFVFRHDTFEKDLQAQLSSVRPQNPELRPYSGGRLPKGFSPGLNMYTFTTEFFISDAVRREIFDLFLAPVESPYNLYINGTQIGVVGQYIDQYNSFNFDAVSFTVPDKLLNFGSTPNVLTLIVITQFERNSISEVSLGTHYVIEKRMFFRNLVTRAFNQGAIMLTLMISFYFGYIHYLSDRSNLKYLLFALSCFFYSFANINLVINWESVQEVVLLKISRSGFVVTSATLVLFTAAFIGILKKYSKIFLLVLLVMVFNVSLILIQGDKEGIWKVFNTLGMTVIGLELVLCIFMLISGIKQGIKGSGTVLAGYACVLLASVYDMYELFMAITPYFWRIPYGYVTLCLSIFFVLAFENSRVSAKSKEQERSLRIINQEIKKREIIEQELIKARDEAYRANAVKSEFLANMSHEIRTPLNGIMGFAELLIYSDDHKERENYSRQILEESEHLMRLLNDVLDLSKIEVGKLNLRSETFNIKEFTGQLFKSIQGLARKKGLTCHLRLEEKIPEYLVGDPLRLYQILLNLLTNAVKFTEEGSVSLEADIYDLAEDRVDIIFQVKDTGIGIPKEFLPRIFESFVQVDAKATRRYGGSGLGTAIAQELVQLMHGSIEVESEVNKGSCFKVVIPLQIGDESGMDDQSSHRTERVISSYRHAVILLVEDYKPNQLIAHSHLKALNVEVLIAEDGEEGIRMFNEHHVDLVLMDIQLPVMDGMEAAGIIRKSAKGHDIPILALTANAGEETRRKCIDAGMNGVITKPFRRNTFLAVISKILAMEYLDKEETVSMAAGFSISHAFDNLADETGGDQDAAATLIDSFIENVSSQLNIMRLGDNVTVQKEAHKIKGGAFSLFWDDFAHLASLLEESAKDNSEDLAPFIEDLETEFHNLRLQWISFKPSLAQ